MGYYLSEIQKDFLRSAIGGDNIKPQDLLLAKLVTRCKKNGSFKFLHCAMDNKAADLYAIFKFDDGSILALKKENMTILKESITSLIPKTNGQAGKDFLLHSFDQINTALEAIKGHVKTANWVRGRTSRSYVAPYRQLAAG